MLELFIMFGVVIMVGGLVGFMHFLINSNYTSKNSNVVEPILKREI